jgi:esterase/lipase superfamily enzyme
MKKLGATLTIASLFCIGFGCGVQRDVARDVGKGDSATIGPDELDSTVDAAYSPDSGAADDRATTAIPREEFEMAEPPVPSLPLEEPRRTDIPAPPPIRPFLAPEPWPRIELPDEPGEEAAPPPTEAADEAPAPAIEPPEVESPPESIEEGPVLVSKERRFVKVFYGTNRARSAVCQNIESTTWDAETGCTPNDFYSSRDPAAWGASPAESGLEVGTLTVTFPPEHETGYIERPPRIFTIPLRREDPTKDVVISELKSFSSDYEAWVREVQATRRDQAFIYVHGFGNSFAQAARRAAQVAYDLDFDVDEHFRGLTMMYSWASRAEANLTAYLADYDETASRHATVSFNTFLDLVKNRAGVSKVHVIAHSMGNRLVANALDERRAGEPVVDELVLAAPDIVARDFKERFLQTLPRSAQRVTLYVSDNDRALIVSSRLREGRPRVGQVAGGILTEKVAGFNAINASALATDFLGHSYHANNNSMLSDIYCLLRRIPANERPLIEPAGPSWQFLSPEEMNTLREFGPCASPIAVMGPSRRSTWTFVVGGAVLLFALFAFAGLLRRRGRR